MPASYLKNEDEYNLYMQRKLSDKIGKLPVFEGKMHSRLGEFRPVARPYNAACSVCDYAVINNNYPFKNSFNRFKSIVGVSFTCAPILCIMIHKVARYMLLFLLLF